MKKINSLGDLLKYEADKNYCREVMTVASRQNLKMGAVIGIKSATDEIKIVSISDEETDGSDSTFCSKIQMQHLQRKKLL
ncbi:MAG: head decoration protein [Alphaproteobacteria bacterium]|nr:head decoration protein [Alphaproteobacteria bacterium]